MNFIKAANPEGRKELASAKAVGLCAMLIRKEAIKAGEEIPKDFFVRVEPIAKDLSQLLRTATYLQSIGADMTKHHQMCSCIMQPSFTKVVPPRGRFANTGGKIFEFGFLAHYDAVLARGIKACPKGYSGMSFDRDEWLVSEFVDMSDDEFDSLNQIEYWSKA